MNEVGSDTTSAASPRRSSVRVPVLFPVALGLLVIVLVVSVGACHHDEKRIRLETEARVAEIQHIRDTHIAEDYDLMDAALLAVIDDQRLVRALAARDRDRLLELARPLFRRWRNSARITHFYFTDPDRVNILRVHQPERYGDVIDRFTTREAERTRAPARGIELGPLGTLSMRVVYPCFEGDKLVGYMELGHEMHHILEFLRGVRDVEVLAVVRKDLLDREGWEAGMRMLHRTGHWERFPGFVATGDIPAGIPDELLAKLSTEGFVNEEPAGDVIVKAHRKRWVLLPLRDAEGRDIGRLAVILDITDRVAQMERFVLAVALGGTAAAAILLGILFVQVNRIERRLRAAS